MNDDLLNNPRLELDEDMISKINETLEKELNRIESFPNSNFCDELTHEFNQISSNLENMGFMKECRYFRSIEGMVLYIIRKNSHNNHFGHYDFAFQLLNFFTELFKRNLEFYNDHVSLKGMILNCTGTPAKRSIMITDEYSTKKFTRPVEISLKKNYMRF